MSPRITSQNVLVNMKRVARNGNEPLSNEVGLDFLNQPNKDGTTYKSAPFLEGLFILSKLINGGLI